MTLHVASATAASPAATNIDQFIVSSERCTMWRDGLKEVTPTAADKSAMQEACGPLPERLSALRTTYGNDPAIERLKLYDKAGMPTIPLPANITALLSRLDQCGFLGGEINGDGSDEDKAVFQQQRKLRCGDELHRDLQKFRQRYRQNVRINWRLSRYYGDDDMPVPLVPEDVEILETTSVACRDQQHATRCADLPRLFARLKVKYANDSAMSEPYSMYCVWNERHCYDITSGLPVHVEYRIDPKSSKVMTDLVTGKKLIDVRPRRRRD